MTWESTTDSRVKKRQGQYWSRFSRMGMRVEQCLFIKVTERGGLNKAISKTNDIENYVREKKDWKELFTNKVDEANLIRELWAQFFEMGVAGSKIHKRKPWRKKTVTQYKIFWDRYYGPFWGDMIPDEITSDTWQDYINFAQGLSKKGKGLVMFNHHKYFKAFCTFLVKIGKLDKMPLIWNSDPDLEDEDDGGEVYPDETIRFMINNSEGAFRLYVKMGALMGMRSSEITQLHKNRIELDTGGIRLLARDVKTGSKTGKGRYIPIPELLIDDLVEQIHSSQSEYLFPNWRTNNGDRPMDPSGFKKPWDALRIAAGYPNGRYHSLRHSYATKVFANPNVNPVLACRALGMSMTTAERVYIHFQDDHFKLLTKNFIYDGMVTI